MNELLQSQLALSALTLLPPSQAPVPLHDTRRVSRENHSDAEDDCNGGTTDSSAATGDKPAAAVNLNDGNDDNDNGGDDDEPEG